MPHSSDSARLRLAAAIGLVATLACCGSTAEALDASDAQDSVATTLDDSTDDASPELPVATDSAEATSDAKADAPDTAPSQVVWVVNVVQAGGAAAIESFLSGGPGAGLQSITKEFYETHADDVDFLYLLADVGSGSGRFVSVNRAAMPENGLPNAATDSGWGSATRLKATIALRLGGGNGPTLHETLHYWGVFLDGSLGFGKDHTNDWRPHWGVASVNGQHGGFDGSTLRCATPADSVPPCTAEASGRFRYTVASFSPASNGGDSVAYAPLELYLMGLLDASAVTEPIVLMRNADFLEVLPDSDDMLFEADGLDTVTIDDITAIHGVKQPIPEEQRHFTTAFLLVTEAPASKELMDRAVTWSRVFLGAEASSHLLSFEAATGGLATMDSAVAVP